MADIYRSPRKKKKSISGSEASPSKLKEKPKGTKFRQEVYQAIGRTKNHLAAFVARPKKLYFENQLDGEEIILLLRRHFLTQMGWILLVPVFILAPLALTSVPLIDFLPSRFQFIVILMWYLLTSAFILEKFLSWLFNVNIVTDERIIDVDFYNLIYKEISEAEIENIQDVTMVQGSVWQTIFNFGNVIIQTAAEKPQFTFEEVPNPVLVVQVLKKMQLEEKQEILEGRIM